MAHRGKSHAVCYPRNQRAGGSQGRRCDGRANVAVDHNRCDNVEGHVDSLEESERFGEVFWVLELGDECEESIVTHCAVMLAVNTFVTEEREANRMRKQYLQRT